MLLTNRGAYDCGNWPHADSTSGKQCLLLMKTSPSVRAGNQGTHLGFKRVGTHTSHIAYIVAYVVCDNSWVTGIVLWDAGLYLAYQVSANVSCLGVKCLRHTGKSAMEEAPGLEA